MTGTVAPGISDLPESVARALEDVVAALRGAWGADQVRVRVPNPL